MKSFFHSKGRRGGKCEQKKVKNHELPHEPPDEATTLMMGRKKNIILPSSPDIERRSRT
jgi:hypothetical protein